MFHLVDNRSHLIVFAYSVYNAATRCTFDLLALKANLK